jgi:glycosyltransferase involved in cell wall biosynthesis
VGLRVAFINHVSAASGAELTLGDLLANLPADVEPVAVAPGPKDAPLSQLLAGLGVPRREIPEWRPHRRPPSRFLADMVQLGHVADALGEALRALEPDVVHANSLPAAMLVVAARGPWPWVWQARDLRAMRRAVGRVAGRADLVAAISRCVADFVTACAPAAAGKVRVVYNGVDVARLRAAAGDDREGVRAELGVAPGQALIGAAAQLVPWKRLDLLLDVAASMAAGEAAGEPVFAVLGGDLFGEHAAHLDELRARAERLAIADRVRWLGHRPDAPRILAALDVYLHTAPDEPLGRAVLEAMALGVPVVAPAACGPAEIIRDGETGLLYPPGDPAAAAERVEGLLRDPERAEALTAAARRDVEERFSAARMAADYAALYRELAR